MNTAGRDQTSGNHLVDAGVDLLDLGGLAGCLVESTELAFRIDTFCPQGRIYIAPSVDACRIGAGGAPLIDTSCLANERLPCTRLELPEKLPFATPGRPHTSTPPFPNIHTTTSLSSPISPHISHQASNPVDSPLKAAEPHRPPFQSPSLTKSLLFVLCFS
jgi:hypothetical protein